MLVCTRPLLLLLAACYCPLLSGLLAFTLTADIVCFQETKLAGADLCPVPFERIAGVPGWQVPLCCMHMLRLWQYAQQQP